MALTPGTRLGPYEIVTIVGAGGMGEVYRARDSRLNRDVAVKVMPAAFGADPERLQRFEKEARAAAALNHSNILAVYDVGSQDGSPYIVSELLEGETLADRLAGSTGIALPVRKAAEIAIQIARGIAAAHDRGIVHRDLKPANVFITSGGQIKILDFGLAKLTERAVAPGSMSALTTPPDTVPGIVMGTIGYMSPEQVRGVQVDHRSDIFALGGMLYEMLAGRRAFPGDTTADTMTAILKEDPADLPVAERQIPPALARIVDRCLEKNPAARFKSADDLAFALEVLLTSSGSVESIASLVVPATSSNRTAWTVAAALTLVAVVSLAFATVTSLRRPPVDDRTMRFLVAPPEGEVFGTAATVANWLAVSPDGHWIAFVALRGDQPTRLWLRPLDAVGPQALAATEGAAAPFWSPDSKSLGFFADGKLKKIDVTGGPPVPLCDVTGTAHGTWSRADVILFATDNQPLQKVSASGGIPTPATSLADGEASHTRPFFLPDSRHFLYRVAAGPPGASGRGAAFKSAGGARNSNAQGQVFAASLDSADRVPVLTSGSSNVVYTQGHLLFLSETTLMAQPFDLDRLTLTGEPFPVAEQIQRAFGFLGIASGFFSASDDGVLAYATGTAPAQSQLAWVDRTGRVVETIADGDQSDVTDLRMSSDGKRASVSIRDASSGTNDIWLTDLTRGLSTRFTFDTADDSEAIWSPDGSRLVFASNRKGVRDLYQKASSGAGTEDLLLADTFQKHPVGWSPDGRFILYSRENTGPADTDLWMLPIFGERKPVPLVQTPAQERNGQFSPDGRWIAYTSNENGRPWVYVAAFPGPGGMRQVSTSSGGQPLWRSDGKELFYFSGPPGNQLMAVEVNGSGAGFEVGPVVPLFTMRPPGPRSSFFAPSPFFAPAPNGQRFLVSAVLEEQGPPQPLTVVVNWAAALDK